MIRNIDKFLNLKFSIKEVEQEIEEDEDEDEDMSIDREPAILVQCIGKGITNIARAQKE